jgi:hypothetical protein
VITTVPGAAQHELRSWYPQFRPACPPRETSAVRAWLGRIQPFPDGTEYDGVMAHFELEELVRVKIEGRLAHPRPCKQVHKFRVPFSAVMRSSFEILLLEFAGSQHPRVYGVTPEISRRRFPTHPHLRDGQPILFNGQPLQALCTYLSSDGVVNRDEMRLVQALDYTAMYLAKHLLWVATSSIQSFIISSNRFSNCPNRGALLTADHGGVYDGTSSMVARFYRIDARFETSDQQLTRFLCAGKWSCDSGLWIGKSAPHFIEQLLREVAPNDECHCGSGLFYGNCCRPKDLRMVS